MNNFFLRDQSLIPTREYHQYQKISTLAAQRKTKVKKALAAILLTIIFISQVGYYFIYTIHQYILKEEMEKELLAHIPDSSLELIIAEEFGEKIEWEEKNKEFLLNEELYDVARIEIKDGKTHLYCINDKKEKQLLDNLVNAVNKNHDTKKERNNVKPVLTDLFFTTTPDSLHFFSYSFTYDILSVSIISSFKEIKSPPPKA